MDKSVLDWDMLGANALGFDLLAVAGRLMFIHDVDLPAFADILDHIVILRISDPMLLPLDDDDDD